METLIRMKELMEKISIDSYKVYKKGNHSASIRARRNAQELKEIVPQFRKEILEIIKNKE